MNSTSSMFDSIRVKPAKGSRRGAAASAGKQCGAAGCEADGKHRGPQRKPADPEVWYCSAHIKEANTSFNFFEGMSNSAAQAEIRASQYGDRKTRPLNADPREHGREARIERAFQRSVWSGGSNVGGEKPAGQQDAVRGRMANAPPAVRRALSTMGLSTAQATPEGIKDRFRELVKQLHPDSNGNLPHAAEQLRKVIEAHTLLRKSGYC